MQPEVKRKRFVVRLAPLFIAAVAFFFVWLLVRPHHVTVELKGKDAVARYLPGFQTMGTFHTENITVDDVVKQRGSVYSTIVVDLAQAPYSVKVNDSTAANANTTGVNLAINTFKGTYARLVLPPGLIYFGQDGTNNWSIKFDSTVTKETLVGAGEFATTLAQFGAGDGGEWDLIVVNGQNIELAEFGVYQDTITTPDPVQENHLIAIYDGAADIYGHDISFGKSIGDELRYFSNAGTITNIHFANVLMHGHGTVTSAPPNGRVGSRSGIAFQRGCNVCEFDHFYVDGVQNSPIDEEPSGTANANINIHDGYIDQTQANSSVAISIAGVSGGAIDQHQRLTNVTVLGGKIEILQTNDLILDNVKVISTAAFASSPTEPLMQVRQNNQDIVLNNLYLSRTGTSGNGNVLDIENTAGGTTVSGGTFIEGVHGWPIAVDANNDLKIQDCHITYTGTAASSFDGILIDAVDGNVNNPKIDNVSITSTGTLHAGVYVQVRTPRTMNNLSVTNLTSPNATTCVQTSLGVGGTLDPTPILEGIECGVNAVWYSGDAGDNPVTTLYPIVGGNKGATVGAPIYEGTATTPEGVLTATQGAIYTYLGGASTTRWFKSTGTGNTGWVECETGGNCTLATLTIKTNGDAALFSTLKAASSDGLNIVIGGGGQLGVVNVLGTYTASRNISLGNNALLSNVDGYNNIAIGVDALKNNYGINAGLGANQGHDNIAVGDHACEANVIGETNICIGGNALAANQLTRNSVAIGFNALAASTAQENIAIGTNSSLHLATGTQNITIGVTFVGATAGDDNIVMGHDSMGSCTTGCSDNIAIGVDVLQNVDSVQNVGIGTFALRVVTGYDNVGIGIGAGDTTTSGHDSTFIGTSTGLGITTGSMNTILGANVHGLATTTEAKIILADGDVSVADYIWFDAHVPTSVNHGTLGTGSSNTVGNVTGVGANTSVVLTYSNGGFPNRSWCQATPNTHTGLVEVIIVTNSKTAPTFSCFDTVTGAASNCEDFTYWCSGQ